ncbi:MAG: HNH endonuclease [Marinilabiliaceae bacterium]
MNKKVGNFGRLDSCLRAKGITGLTHGAHLEEDVWEEFMANPEQIAYECELILARRRHQVLGQSAEISIDDLPVGVEREVVTLQRVGQRFFRDTVLAAYEGRCCVTGIESPLLVEACHISNWAVDERNRTNPRNGLCMSPLFHKAFDNMLFAVTPDCVIEISDEFLFSAKGEQFRSFLVSINHQTIILPNKFLPDRDLLANHYEEYRRRL